MFEKGIGKGKRFLISIALESHVQENAIFLIIVEYRVIKSD